MLAFLLSRGSFQLGLHVRVHVWREDKRDVRELLVSSEKSSYGDSVLDMHYLIQTCLLPYIVHFIKLGD